MKRGFARSDFLAWLVFGAAAGIGVAAAAADEVATPVAEDVFLRVSRRCTGGRAFKLCEEDCVSLADVVVLLLVAAGVDVGGFAGDDRLSPGADVGCWREIELRLSGGRPRGAII